ncbi:hypothetical protein CC1G_10339 [Coprinopsis cinerea okayama7|uniref:Uncharacterized protein n=1 Tax=Coprinopsis cinerea (strain Okayama-7 / 130 / ATCC MYA-4618 / FGSC 9003) TaxID=240176 RepID=A8P0L1_COPC7|nr:hypothetical protein CC1G_10339 [Coprinopsis cinerea okayama7\|eukprot:XP_001837918.1 hypothetical protein CC1G_10339 [Coprinopsis cinerea okayama7\
MAKAPLSPQAQRLKTIIVALPILVASSVVFYKREFQGEPRRTLPNLSEDGAEKAHASIIPTPSERKSS